jgi:NodT family efflux transporter outer membrane factor (OMF) lipoprotein
VTVQLKRVLAFVVCALTFSACKVGPEYKRPELSIADEWNVAESPGVRAESADHGEWWSTFEDPELTELITLAHQENLSLRGAGLRIMEARAELGRAVGNLYPQQQGAFGSYSRVKLSGEASPVPISGLPFESDLTGSFDSYQVGLGAVWEADIFGGIRRGIDAADAAYIASVAGYDDLLVSLTAEVASTFVVIRTIEERLVLARRNVEIQERGLELAESRFRNGATSELDVSQAKALLGTTKALVPALETAQLQARNGLGILLGRRSDQVAEVLNGPGTIPTAPTSVAVGIPADLMRRRPDVRLAELQAMAQCSMIGVAKADLLPKFGIGGAFGWSAESSGDLFGGDADTGFIGPYFTWDILNYGRITNNTRAQDAKFQTLLVHYQSAVLRAQREVEDALAGFGGSQREVAALSEAVTAAERSVELAMDQYIQGAAPYTRVLNTQQFLTLQQDFLTSSRGDVCRNLIGLYRALGGGWQIRQGKAFVPTEIKEQMQARTDWGDLLEDAEDAPDKYAEPLSPSR